MINLKKAASNVDKTATSPENALIQETKAKAEAETDQVVTPASTAVVKATCLVNALSQEKSEDHHEDQRSATTAKEKAISPEIAPSPRSKEEETTEVATRDSEETTTMTEVDNEDSTTEAMDPTGTLSPLRTQVGTNNQPATTTAAHNQLLGVHPTLSQSSHLKKEVHGEQQAHRSNRNQQLINGELTRVRAKTMEIASGELNVTVIIITNFKLFTIVKL